ncbi:MAG: hypothetical protein RLZ92_1962 [Pseudomonadota bacterium]|jgi:hypothetical protein
MKRLLLIVLSISLFFSAISQVGIGTNSPSPNAILDISSTSKGLLPPRMSIGDRDAISNPPAGLLIFNTSTRTIQVFDGNSWTSLSPVQKHYVGESYGGGIVFYVYDNGQHGLIAATADQSGNTPWSPTLTSITTSTAIGSGLSNTQAIIADQGNNSSYAAKICADYSVTVNGITYDDWYLPSESELVLLYNQSATVGGFVYGYYWSSTQASTNYARAYILPEPCNCWCNCTKNGNNGKVRAIRSF